MHGLPLTLAPCQSVAMTVSSRASEALAEAKSEIENPDWLKLLARVGFGAKGVVYLVVGALAAQGVAGTGPEGALTAIVRQPFGRVMLGIVAVGLLAYAAWRIVQGVLDPEREGSDGKALAKRVGYCCSGVVYLALALSAARLVIGDGGGGSGGGAEGWTAKLMSVTFGQWLVALVGLGVLGGGAHQAKQAIGGDFMEKFARGEMSATQRTWVERAGRLGHAARAVLYAIVGGFLLHAAWTANAEQAGGIGQALDKIQEQPYGPWLLVAAGVGLVCYGLYCFVMARYRKAVVL